MLAAVDLFVLPSLWEGLSMALLEAMAAAAPIVATRVSGTDQALGTGEAGWVVPPGDEEALAAAILEALADEEGARRRGHRARRRVEEEFGIARQVERYLALYREVAGDCP